MNVTRKNFNILHDALLKHFGAEEFVVLDLWCRIGIRRADGNVYALTTSHSYFDTLSSNALFTLLLEHGITAMKATPSLSCLSMLSGISIDEVKMAVIRAILKHMKCRNLFVVKYLFSTWNPEYMLTKSYAEFAVNFDING